MEIQQFKKRQRNLDIIKKFNDGTYLKYGKGSFDNWCVYLVDENGKATPPLDTYYFEELYHLANKYGKDKVYKDFVSIYDITGKKINEQILQRINNIAQTYSLEDILDVDKLFTTLYMAMVAEENYPGTKLGRKIKRLGIYEMLFSGKNINEAANFMRGMNWREINELCRERGF